MARLLFGLLMIAWPFSTWGAQVALSPLNVISSSLPFTNDYPASNVLDQQSGPTPELFAQHYWLSPDNARSPVFFVIDLGAAMRLIAAELFNTHNGAFGDRGTGSFTLLGGNTAPAPGGMLDGATTLVSGTLAAASAGVPVGEAFAIGATAMFRYVEFAPSSTASVRPMASPTAFGLNEIELFSAPPVPEAGTAPCLAATVAVLLLCLTRRSPGPTPAGTRPSPASARWRRLRRR